MSKEVLILDNYDSFTYNLAQVIKEHGGFNLQIRLNDQVKPDDIGGFDKIIFSPGPGIPSDARIMSEIIETYGQTKSILGICLGHQAIAEAFGGKILKMNKPCHGVKQQILLIKRDDYIFSGLSEEIYAGLYHSWEVSKDGFPSFLDITAVSSSGVIMAISHQYYDIKGLQFHPESVMTNQGKKILHNWLDH